MLRDLRALSKITAKFRRQARLAAVKPKDLSPIQSPTSTPSQIGGVSNGNVVIYGKLDMDYAEGFGLS